MNKLLTVSQLNNYIKGVFDDELILHNINVTGEIFEFKTSGGNSYITLKEGECSLYCVYFASKVEYKIGQRVCVTGRVGFYPKSGKMHFNITDLKLVGRGELLTALEEIKARLQKEGIFDNRRDLPAIIKKIAILSSCEGAVIHDFLNVVASLNYLSITIFDVKVQGEGASNKIASTMSDINNGIFGKFDVLLIARGGGSAGDLNEFNSEALARAIHESRIPVISAIGHETDFTLSDFAADIRAGTPSIAAGLIKENNGRFFERLFVASMAARNAIKEIYRKSLIRLGRFAERGQTKLYSKSRKAYNSIILNALNIHVLADKKLQKENKKCAAYYLHQTECLLARARNVENRINLFGARLNELNPAKILSKGYAKIYKNDRSVQFSKDLKGGDNIQILMSDGKALAMIKEESDKNLDESG